jgi:DNA helicase II / ATP-dependent DNA helicase PcrA
MNKISGKFDAFYRILNAAQREAVDSIEGPVMVVAGPGTGKTQVLTLRIANILIRTDTPPENILALTFTESGVASMRRRLSEIIGSPAYSVGINTFHGFCNEIIKNYPEDFPRIIGSTHVTEVDQITILENLIKKEKLKELKPFGSPFHYLKVILQSINELKREGIAPADFNKIIREEEESFKKIEDLKYVSGPHKGKMKGKYQELDRGIKKNKELSRLYGYYEESLKKEKLYDYTDMILEVLREFQVNEDLLLTLQEKHQYILVDEHQDTNNAQNKVVELLASFHESPNVFVVGDEKQAIFRFQGASLENFLYFKKLYPGAKLITLEESYRSTQTILDSAESLIKSSKALRANSKAEEKPVRLFTFSAGEIENYFLSQDISEKLGRGINPGEIAVLYRDNRDAISIMQALEKAGVPFSVESDQNILDDFDVKKLLLIFRAVENFGKDEQFIEALHVDFLNILPLDLYKLLANRIKNGEKIFEVVSKEEKLKKLNLETARLIHDFYRKVSGWHLASKNKSLVALFEIVVRESGLLAHVLKEPENVEKMDKISMLFDEVKELVGRHKNSRLKDFLNYLDTLEEHNILIKKASSFYLARRVRLMTAHRAKGQEFEYVYVVNTFDGHWGNRRRAQLLKLPPRVYRLVSRAIDPGGSIDDERRLFYVAVTRAKREVTITYSKESPTKREQLPSLFINEIKPELIQIGDAGRYEKEFLGKKEILFAPSLAKGINIKDKDFIHGLFLERGLSVTALNNYLSCPWKYFYNNLLRIPKAPSKHQMYGIAIHKTLKDFFDLAKEQELKKEFLIKKFSYYLNQQPLNSSDLEETREKGVRALEGYFDTYNKRWRTNVLGEFNVPGAMISVGGKKIFALEIRLTGKIDKLEFLGAGKEVNVVDYKTGRPKSRGFIEGRTKNSNGDYKRQLIFYNILLNIYGAGRYKMISGDIDFIEPDEKGKYHKENFLIQADEIVELKELITKVASEILAVEFWNKHCDNNKCEFCELRNMMK